MLKNWEYKMIMNSFDGLFLLFFDFYFMAPAAAMPLQTVGQT